MTTNEPTVLLPLEEVERRLSLSRRAIEKLIAAGSLPSIKLGRRRLVVEAELHQFIEALRAGSAQR